MAKKLIPFQYLRKLIYKFVLEFLYVYEHNIQNVTDICTYVLIGRKYIDKV